eukprot:EC785369.1.p3 GENE.EC785369.1~~EC785369.1.p3  ORF type:complete len:79 (-),score=10.94 EC785369.1:74-310(-)
MLGCKMSIVYTSVAASATTRRYDVGYTRLPNSVYGVSVVLLHDNLRQRNGQAADGGQIGGQLVENRSSAPPTCPPSRF